MSRDTKLLHPKLRSLIPVILEECKQQGLNVLITDCFRTQPEQDALYAQGRTAPGGIVTNARYPDSAHCWGVAFDFCRNVKGLEYDNSDCFFTKVAVIAKKHGLEWGGDWKRFVDRPHLQLPEFMPNNSTSWLKNTYGTPTVFINSWERNAPSSWYREACDWSVEQGLFKGDGSGDFHWSETVTREQLAQVLYNLYH